MNGDLAARIAQFLNAHHVMSLATVGEDGAHAANVFYVRDGLALIWVSDPASRHSRHIAAQPAIAATIAPDYADFPEIRGLQISGHAGPVAGAPEQARAQRLLQARYPFLQRTLDGPPELAAAYQRAQFFRLDPARIVMIDNTRGFGAKETLVL
jgi:uncharacterized protein YhbP (UPF0306 family)